MRMVLGLDPGTVRWGVAVAEDDGSPWAFPEVLAPIDGRERAAALTRLRSLIAERSIQQIVMGLPLELSGREGKSAKNARTLASIIEREVGVSVALIDERLTSKEAERQLRASGVSAKSQRGRVDSIAASILLTTYLAMPRSAAR